MTYSVPKDKGIQVRSQEYRKKAEKNMVNLVKEAQESKKKIILTAMVAILVFVAATPLFILSGTLEMDTWLRMMLIVTGSAVIVIGIAIACALDREAGAFECPAC